VEKTDHVVIFRVQGDQIGRIFAHWVIVCFEHVIENYRNSPHFGSTYFHGKGFASILTKKVGLYFRRLFHKLIWSPCLGWIIMHYETLQVWVCGQAISKNQFSTFVPRSKENVCNFGSKE
jgi:hypothetical protein